MIRMLFLLALLPLRSFSHTLRLIHFKPEIVTRIFCEPFRMLNIQPDLTSSGDTSWVSFEGFTGTLYPCYSDMTALQTYYMVLGPDTTTVDLAQLNVGKGFQGQCAAENNLLYLLYFRTGMLPFGTQSDLSQLITAQQDSTLQIGLDPEKEENKLTDYLAVFEDLAHQNTLKAFYLQTKALLQSVFQTRMVTTYLVLNDHTYTVPQKAGPSRLLYQLVDQLVYQKPDSIQATSPFIIEDAEARQEYRALKEQAGAKTHSKRLLYWEDSLFPIWEAAAQYPEPGRSLLLLYVLQKAYTSPRLRDSVYPAVYQKTVQAYPEFLQDSGMVRLFRNSLATEQQKAIGKTVSDTLQVLDSNRQRVALRTLVANGKGIVIIAWASWCGRCGESIAVYNSLAQAFSSRVNFISLSIDENPSAWKKGLRGKALAGSPYRDPGFKGSFVHQFNIDHVPQTFVLDQNLKIVSFGSHPDYVAGRALIEKLLSPK